MLESVGTIVAIFVALFLGYYSFSEEKRNRPKIKIEYNEELRVEDKDWCQLGINIVNNGKLTAKNINIRIEKIIQNGDNLIPEGWRYVHFRSIPALQNGEYQFIAILNATKDQDFVTFSKSKIKSKRDTFTIHFIITGDNISAFKKAYKFINSTDHNKITFEEI
ncbi:unnamed protein product [marine sediment metagenome]|uniref:Uncharacterized protein n=1 Tax=marine sediment metagenome TaxID=412755 RepID=X0ZV14_9ZZZZ